MSAAVSGIGIKRVRFLGGEDPSDLSVRSVDSESPFEAWLDVGSKLRRFHVRAEGLDRSGKVLASESKVLNAGPHRFVLTLREVQHAAGGVVFDAEITSPPGALVERVEFFARGRPLATVFGPRWQLRLSKETLGKEPLGIRAVASLDSGATAEDTLLVNAPGVVDKTDVRIVEVFFSATDKRGDPITDVAREQLILEEEGEAQQILGFSAVDRLSVSVALLTDASSSMTDLFSIVQQGSVDFFRSFLREGDRGSFGVFNHHYELVVPLTSDIDWLADGSSAIRVSGGTALYDSIIYSLYNLGGLGGRRALVIFSDGEDTDSRFRAKDALDQARRAGVAIYPILLETEQTGGTSMSPTQSSRDSKRVLMRRSALGRIARLAEATGGFSQVLGSAGDLRPLLGRIAEDLRSQYRLTYQSPYSKADGVYRSISLATQRKDMTIRTIRGYYAH